MKKQILIIVLSLLAFYAQSDGVSLSNSRLIFNESNSNINFSLHNNSAETYLIQSVVLNQDLSVNKDVFQIIPPLFRLEKFNRATGRIIINNISSLPEDRESAFLLANTVIPSTNRDSNENQASLTVATRIIIKLFYRPSVLLELDIIKESEKLTFKQDNCLLTVNNPTPFNITFGSFIVNNEKIEIEQQMSAPMSNLILTSNYCEPIKGINYSIIDDFGGISKKYTVKF